MTTRQSRKRGKRTHVNVKDAQVTRMPRTELAVIIHSHHATPVEQPVQTNGALMPFFSKQA